MMEGESLNAELSRLIGLFGIDAVKNEAERLGRKKSGRRREADFGRYKHEIEREARLWLKQGGELKPSKSLYALAKELAQLHPKKMVRQDSVEKRFQRSLKNYESLIKVSAWRISEAEKPYKECLLMVAHVCDIEEYEAAAKIFTILYEISISRYWEKFGEPSPDMTIRQIELLVNQHAEAGNEAPESGSSTSTNILADIVRSGRDKKHA